MKKVFKFIAIIIAFLLSFTLFRKVAAKLKLKCSKRRMAKLV